MYKSFQQTRIETLNQDLEKLNKDYQVVAEKKRRESNPQEEHNLELQLNDIAKKIDEIEQDIKQIKEKFTLEEIRKEVINFFLSQTGQYPSDNLKIEIFLPSHLINEPVDSWEIDKNKDNLIEEEDSCTFTEYLGSKYKSLVIRSSERLKRAYLVRNNREADWQKYWNTLQKIINNSVDNTFILCDEILREDGNWQPVYIQFKRESLEQRKIGIIQKTPIREERKNLINFILKMAIPAALWLRSELSANCNEQVDELLRCYINQLDKNIKDKRLDASAIEDKDSHIGNHISLLWENPYRLPPDITYSM